MPLIVPTPARRRIVVGILLGLGVMGAAIRAIAPDPSALRDVGTLLLVMWLPAVGNLVAWLVQQWRRKTVRVTEFPSHSGFSEHLRAQVDVLPLPSQVLAGFDPADRRCTLIVGSQGFTARLHEPAVQVLGSPGSRRLVLELLRPEAALPHLAPGTRFHLLVGQTAAASGCVLA